ncbi:MAG: energy transducer TonB [Bryobacterales bacterium]|nr:energy transducer TonB [Bryobacterales bacterium]
MVTPFIRIAALVGVLGVSTLEAQPAAAVLRAQPLLTPQEAGNLESRVLQDPEDMKARTELLQFYLDTTPLPRIDNSRDDPGRRNIRLQHILYLVEHHPEAAASASKFAYVYRANGPYANAQDHDAVRDEWLAAVQGHPKNTAVTLNAVKFLEVEDRDEAEDTLRRTMDADPDNRELAVNLGFLYAKEVLAGDTHATAALEQSSNAIVVAAAGTALPNLAKGISGRVTIDPKVFDLANELSAQARQMAPDDKEIQGLMPFITYFAAAEEALGGAAAPAPSSPGRIRVGGNVQAANLIRKTEPIYPALAQQAGITGQVQLTAIIGRDGTIQNVQLISGHPLLVQAAVEAVETWLYKPTLLNGSPVEVVTTVTVSFPPN